jgi:uncharacterized membrane protein YbaN (DUF454 family)
MNTIKKYFFIISGCISLGLGVAGIFLPLLPTTPFLLLASFCFLRSSSRLHKWLLGHKLFGSFIRSYLEHRTIPVKVKISALVLLWISIILTAFILGKIFLTLLLAGIAFGVSIHILSLRSSLSPRGIPESSDKTGDATGTVKDTEPG